MAHLLAKQIKSCMDSELVKSCLLQWKKICLESTNLHQTISVLVRKVAQKAENFVSNNNSQLKTKVDYFD